MLNQFPIFIELWNKNKVTIGHPELNMYIKKYSFYYISETFNFHQNDDIIKKIKESEIIIIDQYKEKETNEFFYFICYKSTLLIIKDLSITKLQALLSNNIKIKAYLLFNDESIFTEKNFPIKFFQIENDVVFKNEISEFCNSFIFRQNSIANVLRPVISGYLIKQSYLKLEKEKQLDFSMQNDQKNEIKKWNGNEFIQLRKLGFGSSFTVNLFYHIEKEELFAIKIPYGTNTETPKLVERELSNYKEFNYPFLPKGYGTVKNTDNIIIQFINGQTLKKIQNIDLDYNDKITIIFELMMTMNYFHKKDFVYRDLKPDNVMIDSAKTPFIIDFDRIVNIGENNTTNFGSIYAAPEFNFGINSNKSDVYSIGQMIYYILNEKTPDVNKQINKIAFKNNQKILKIYEKCTSESIEQRPSIPDLMFEFYLNFMSNIKIAKIRKDPEVQYIRNVADFILNISDYCPSSNKGEKSTILKTMMKNLYIKQDINKALHYYKLAANQNIPQAQYCLGILYSEGECVQRDIKQAIHYLTLAANQNHSRAQLHLGFWYDQGINIQKDMNKAFYYYSLAANQSEPVALNLLAVFYLKGEYVHQDYKKGIHYLTLSANQNNSVAQYSLGVIYYNGEIIARDINKAIKYLTLASNQGHKEAQFILGQIYQKGKNIGCDINKAIKYYLLAAKQGHKEAQFNLGQIYHLGEKIKVDLNEAIRYYKLAADQNHPQAQFNLGSIYLYKENINEAIHYYQLASKQNVALAQYNLGVIYIKKEYNNFDVDKGIYYLTLAAKQNILKAQINLAIIFDEGLFYCKRDSAKALYYYMLAANQNNPIAQFKLGNFFLKGKYVKKDIEKAIHYFTLSSKNDFMQAQFNLALIFFKGTNVPIDLNKAIHYFTLAANHNYSEAQLNLGLIYTHDKLIEKNINKAIHYFTLAADQNNCKAQFCLGYIYRKCKYIKQDITKSIYYYSLAASHNFVQAQFDLGLIYYEGELIHQNINKAIQYFTQAANNNHSKAQFYLGILYLIGLYIRKDINKGVKYLLQSSNYDINANFSVGYLYHQGEYIQKDIIKALHYYKEVSSINGQFVKNNLGIIYKNEIECKNLNNAIIYLDEAIKNFNDKLAMYNLASIYIFNSDIIKEKLDDAIILLIKSMKLRFLPSKELLCVALVKKHSFVLENIEKDLIKKTDHSIDLSLSIKQMIKSNNLLNENIFKKRYQYLKNIDFVYDYLLREIPINHLINQSKTNNSVKLKKDISSEFYDGFGNDI